MTSLRLQLTAATLMVLHSSASYSQTLFNNAVKGGLSGEGLRTNPRKGGGDYSEVQLGNAAAAATFRLVSYRLADDFEVAGARWRVRKVIVWGFQNDLHYPSVNQGFFEIRRSAHDGPIAALGEFYSAEMTDIFRIFTNQPTDMFQCQKITFASDALLPPGRYWLVFAGLGVRNVDGPWCPFLTPVGALTVPGANAKARTAGTHIHWVDLLDPGSFVPLDLPFWIDGEKLPITAQPGERVDPPMVVPDPVAYLQRGVW